MIGPYVGSALALGGGGGGGDLGNGNVWQSASVGTAGIAAARAAAGSDLAVGDVIVTGWPSTPEFFAVASDGAGNLHVLPVALPNGALLQPAGIEGFAAQVPDAGDWTDASLGTGAWSESGGVVTGTSVDTGNNEARAIAGDQASALVLAVYEGLSAVASANGEVEITTAVSTSNRYLSTRNTGGVWYMDASGGVTTQSISVAVDLEVLADGAGNLAYWRFGRTGAWSSKAFANTFAFGYGARLRADRAGGASASVSCTRAALVTL